jgi:hypothetical protein
MGTKKPKPEPNLEGPLKPGRIRVPRSPITNPRDLLPPPRNSKSASAEVVNLADIEKKIEGIRKKAYRDGWLAGHSVGYALGIEENQEWLP